MRTRGEERCRRQRPKYRLQQHCLILVMGVAGSGKTTLARQILRRISAVYLDNNHIADAFFPRTRQGARYEKLRPYFYRVLYKIAEENLKLGESVLLDVPHIKEVQTRDWRDLIEALARRTRSRLVAIRCFCSEKTLRTRLRSRGEGRDRGKLRSWAVFLKEQPIEVAIPFPHLEINSETHLERNSDTAVRYCRSAGRLKTCFR
jgi:predicted kinase